MSLAVIGGQMSVTIAFPLHVTSSMWSVPVEALLCECHLYVQGLLQQHFLLSSGIVQYWFLCLQARSSNSLTQIKLSSRLFLTDLQLLYKTHSIKYKLGQCHREVLWPHTSHFQTVCGFSLLSWRSRDSVTFSFGSFAMLFSDSSYCDVTSSKVLGR